MAWFSKKQPVAVVEQVAPRKVTTGPRLAVLTPDIAGISTFSLSLQDDAAGAESMISPLRADVRRGTHAFWAMHDRPAVDESMHVEALVLIRAKTDSDLVYVVSFLDLESALSFTRFEVRRGLYIGNVMVYWAAFAQVREELEGVSILPSIAPPSIIEHPLGPDPRISPPLPKATVTVAEPVAEPESEVESIAESEARQAVEQYLEKNPEPAPELIAEQPQVVEDSAALAEPPVVEEAPAPGIKRMFPIFDDEPVTEEAAVADALVLQHPPVAEPVVDVEPIAEPVADIAPPESDLVFKRRPAPFAPKRRWSAREARQQAAAEERQRELVAQAQPEVVTEAQPEVVAEAPQIVAAEPEVIAAEPEIAEAVAEAFPTAESVAARPPESILETDEHEALKAIAERITTYAGDEEAESEAATIEAIQIEATAPAIDPANGLPQAEKYNEFDIALEVERLLKNRKWETREGPFRGFKSPPGKF